MDPDPRKKTEDDPPVRYIERTAAYYRALGYGAPYRWASFDRVPFQRLAKPLSETHVAIVTTAARYRPDLGDQGPGAPYNAAAKFYRVYAGSTARMPDLRIAHLSIDRDHTTGEDIATYFPLAALRRARRAGRIGPLAPRFFGLPTNRSQATTLEVDCPALVEMARADGVDAAILVPNCPVCHQSAALAARALEAAGIATVILGAALDIVERVGVPRLLFSDFPLGNAAGRPNDEATQTATLNLALDLLEAADAPRTTWRSPLTWTGARGWKDDYCNADRLTPDEAARRRAAFDAGKATAAALRARAGV